MRIPLSECIAPHFHETHKQIKKDVNTEYWLRGGRGSTKSSFIAIEVVLAIIRNPEANVVVFRRFENEVRDSVFTQVQWAIFLMELGEEFKFYVRPFKIVYKKTGQVILFKAADKPQKIKSIKIPKGFVKYVWFEEVDQFAGMYQIRNILQSLLRGTTEVQTVFYSYNPPKSARSWTNAETKIAKPGRVVHYSDYRTVPEEWLGETFLHNAEHLKLTDPEAYRHEYLGEETGTGLEVFDNVELRPITDKEIAYFDHRNQGLDFGYAADPLCFLEGHFDAKKRRLYLFDEIQGVGIKNSDLVRKLSEDQLAELTLADSSEPKSIDELRIEHGMNITGAEKAPGSVDHGIKYLQDLEKIIIDPARCPLAATEFINYALDVDRYGETISKYPDKANHCFIGSTLVSTRKGPVRIDAIRPGDMVITRQGPRKVNKVFINHLPVVTTKLLNGKSLTLTDTHEIITKHGKVLFRDLTIRDTVYYEDGACGFIETENRKLPYLRAKGIAAIRRANDEMTECISRGRVEAARTNTSMLRSMRSTVGLYRKVAIFTIKTATLSTITRAISAASAVQSICLATRKSITRAMKTLFRKTLTGFGPLRRFGIRVMKAARGILGTPHRYFRIVAPFNGSVSSVELPSIRSTLEKLDFAQTRANQRGGVPAGLTMSRGNARSVDKPSKLIDTPRLQDVYDIEVDEVHEYFANGLLVSNSIDAARYMMDLHIRQTRKERRKKKRARAIPTVNRWGR